MKMKIKKIVKFTVISIAAVMPFFVSASMVFAGPDDRDVMLQIIHSPMLPAVMTVPKETGTLLLSDSPEYATEDGVLYTDLMKGDCRVYFYHVNQMNGPRKIAVMAYNPSDKAAMIYVNRYQFSWPSDEYYRVGKELSLMYYEMVPTSNKIQVPPLSYAVIGQRINAVAIQPEALYSGIVDMTLSDMMQIFTVIMPYDADPVNFVKKCRYLESDAVKLRGSFHGMNRELGLVTPYLPSEGIRYITVADGRVDRFVKGKDIIDNRNSENVGNYGVDYNINLKTKGKGKIHVYFNPQGGEYAGVVEMLYRNNCKLVEVPPAGVYSMGGNDADAMQYIDSFDAGTDVNIHLMPPGAANLPVRLIIVPDNTVQQFIDQVNADRLRQKQQQIVPKHADVNESLTSGYKKKDKSEKDTVKTEHIDVQIASAETSTSLTDKNTHAGESNTGIN